MIPNAFNIIGSVAFLPLNGSCKIFINPGPFLTGPFIAEQYGHFKFFLAFVKICEWIDFFAKYDKFGFNKRLANTSLSASFNKTRLHVLQIDCKMVIVALKWPTWKTGNAKSK